MTNPTVVNLAGIKPQKVLFFPDKDTDGMNIGVVDGYAADPDMPGHTIVYASFGPNDSESLRLQISFAAFDHAIKTDGAVDIADIKCEWLKTAGVKGVNPAALAPRASSVDDRPGPVLH
ncbi:MAG TPA: hypothetical protein PLO23_06940 [Alphaproteobacteria bacterium]|nr:hypothetical protein [Alphaproteobacteria bacterium]